MDSSSEKKSFLGLSTLEIVLLATLVCLVCAVVGLLGRGFLVSIFSSSRDTAQILSAEDVFQVSAIDVVKDEGYTVTSAVCEVVSSESYSVQGYNFGKIVFHAFRISKPSLGTEAVVLFASNHTASDGSGLVQNINPLAKTLFPDFPDGSRLKHPITMDTPGVKEALECARQAGGPSSLDFGSFDHETWRQEAVRRFGPETVYDDGSKTDYVRIALSICGQSSSERETMRTNLGADYEGSFQQFIIETFCPYVK